MAMNDYELVVLKRINLSNRELRDVDLDVLIRVLKDENAVVEELDLEINYLNLADGKLTDAIAGSKTLRVLKLAWNQIGAEGAKHLADVLKRTRFLHTLWLYCNQIGPEGVKHLAAALKVNSTLRELRLDTNQIGVKGVESISCALISNGSLEDLHLMNNNIGDHGVKYLATALLINQSLSNLWLCENLIDDAGGMELMDALKCNRGIKQIHLVGKDGLNHHHVEEDFVGHNFMGDDIRKTIEAILRKPKRKRDPFSFNQVKDILALKADEFRSLKERHDSSIALSEEKDKEIASLKSQTKLLENMITSKDKKIASLKEELEELKSAKGDTIDLTTDESERASKRPREEINTKSSLAILHESNKKVVQIKQEKCAAETQLNNVQEEKQSIEANLEEVREDLDDANELVGQQSLATNIWQGRFDELVQLVKSGQVDGAAISAIKNRSLASGS